MSETAESLPEIVLPLEEIKPYWRNPRRIPQEAIDAVAESVRAFGYQQPIVVDSDHVIVVGHTRHAALQQLGFESARVYVTDLPEDKVREYRLVDNRTAEFSSWDHNALVLELREFEESLLSRFFPDIDLEVGTVGDMAAVTAKQVSDAAGEVGTVNRGDPVATLTTQVLCPSCAEQFEVRTRSLPGLTYDDLWELVERQADHAGQAAV